MFKAWERLKFLQSKNSLPTVLLYLQLSACPCCNQQQRTLPGPKLDWCLEAAERRLPCWKRSAGSSWSLCLVWTNINSHQPAEPHPFSEPSQLAWKREHICLNTVPSWLYEDILHPDIRTVAQQLNTTGLVVFYYNNFFLCPTVYSGFMSIFRLTDVSSSKAFSHAVQLNLCSDVLPLGQIQYWCCSPPTFGLSSPSLGTAAVLPPCLPDYTATLQNLSSPVGWTWEWGHKRSL